jgi:DNA-directed RNA polymerase specialized sigma subunit
MVFIGVQTEEDLSFYITRTKSLMPRERLLLQELIFRGKSHGEIALMLSISKPRVSQLKSIAIKKVKHTYNLWQRNRYL